MELKIDHLNYKKQESDTCGFACANFITQYFQNSDLNRKDCQNIFWTTDVGSILLKKGINTKIITFNSRQLSIFDHLEKTYLRHEIPKILTHKMSKKLRDSYKSLLGYITKGGLIKNKKIDDYNISLSLKMNLPIIICVSSAEFHDNPKMNGGHFVIIFGENNQNYKVLSPGKKEMQVKEIQKRILTNACLDWGGWAIHFLDTM